MRDTVSMLWTLAEELSQIIVKEPGRQIIWYNWSGMTLSMLRFIFFQSTCHYERINLTLFRASHNK